MEKSLNRNLSLERVKMPYPHIKVLEPSDAIALVVPSLPKGDLAVICEFEGTTRKIASIAYSALVIHNLSKVSSIVFCKDENSKVRINNSTDILEVM